jgi:hypothetical protein
MSSRPSVRTLPVLCLVLAAGCGEEGPLPSEETAGQGVPVPTGRAVETTGKEETALGDVPEPVLAAARQARPDLDITAAEHEVRDGREYYDIGGTLPDGSELELDMLLTDNGWTVVEVQRDLPFEAVPEAVRTVLPPAWRPTRIIESDQGDGVVIYEFFGPGPDGAEVKREVRWADGAGKLLEDEWMH